MKQTDISDQALHKSKTRASGNRLHPVHEEYFDNLESALTELEKRNNGCGCGSPKQSARTGAPFMSKRGDWALAIIMLGVFVYVGYLIWNNWV